MLSSVNLPGGELIRQSLKILKTVTCPTSPNVSKGMVNLIISTGTSVGLRSERSGVRDLPPPCCVLEQDTLLPESTG